MTIAKTGAQRVAKAQDKRLKQGWRRVNFWAPPDVAAIIASREANGSSATETLCAGVRALKGKA